MAKVALFLIDGFEETEALCTTDILRRGKVDVTLISLTGKEHVKSKNSITVVADALFDNVKDTVFDMAVIPGGTMAYADHEGLLELVRRYDSEGKKIGAICAAPAVLGKAGVLKGRKAVCYPSMESYLTGATVGTDIVETDGHITTAKGPAVTPFFGLRLLELLKGKETAKKVADDFLIPLIHK